MKNSIISLTVLFAAPLALADMVTVTDKDFNQKVLESEKPSVVKVSATWCSACTVAKEPFKKLAKDASFNDIQFVELDLDNGKKIAQQFNIQGVPTFLYVNDGKVVFQESGSPDGSAFKKVVGEKIEKHLRTGKKKAVAAPQVVEKPAPAAAPAPELVKEQPSFWQNIKDSINSAWNYITSFFR